MSFSEFAVLLLIYSGLLIYFLVPFSKQEQSNNHYQGQISFPSVYKENLSRMVFHKKAIFALLLVGLALISIQAALESAEWHYNAHSGYSPISNKLPILYSMGSVVIYTVFLVLSVGFIRTLRSMKSAK